MSSSRYRRKGYECIINDAPIIGNRMNISTSHNKAILEIEAHKKKTATLWEHCNRIKYTYEFLEKNYTDYFITYADLNTPLKY